jgi:MYXO-CTERM domain-containing protein
MSVRSLLSTLRRPGHASRPLVRMLLLALLTTAMAFSSAAAQHGHVPGPDPQRPGPIVGVPGRALSDNPSGFPAGWLGVGLAGQTGDAVADSWTWLEQLAPALGLESPRDELVVRRVDVARGETIVRFAQRVGDVPVFRGEVVVVVDADGRLEDLINGYLAFDRPLVERLAERPALTPADALALALADDAAAPPAERVFAVPADAPAEALTRLVYVAPLGSLPTLAWEVHPPGVHLALNWRVFYDAATGRRLWAFNDVQFENEGRVYDPSPGANGDAPAVVRPLRDRDDAEGYLTGPLVLARNCVEDGETVLQFGTITAELCTEKQVAQADAESGDFLFEPDTRAADDLFAEVQMYYHVAEVYAFFQALGFDILDEVPLPATVNFQVPGMLVGSNQTLAPFDNAFFFPAGDILPGVYGRDFDSIVFGQGTHVDFAYDGDVIYHEFGHAVFNTIASPGSFSYDSWGLTAAPGALNEGQADYFAGAFTEDPAIGEYVGPRIAPGTDAARNIRDMGGADSCPTNIIGQVHYDSVHFSAALWDVRTVFVGELGGSAAEFDAAILAAMRRMGAFVTFDQIADIVEGKLLALDAQLAEVLDDVFIARGLRDCQRFIPLGGPLQVHPLAFLYGPAAIGLDPWVPGFMQYRVRVAEEEPANTIAIAFAYGGGGGFGGQAAFPRFAVRRGSPVEISVRGTNVSGRWDDVIRSESDGTGRRLALLQDEAGLEPGDYYFLPVGTAGQQGQMGQVRAFVRLDDLSPGPDPDSDADVGGGDGAGDDVGGNGDSDAGPDLGPGLGDVVGDDTGGGAGQAGAGGDGCGCAASGAPAGADAALLALVALGLLGIGGRRRRLTS